MDKCTRYHKTQYLVKWKDYPDYKMSWELIANLTNAKEAILAFKSNRMTAS
jgi:hypothetical protein